MGAGHSCWDNSGPQTTRNNEPKGRKRRRETVPLIQFIMPTCLWHNDEPKYVETNPEKQQDQMVNNGRNETTLKEWILSSPVSDNRNPGNDHVKQVGNKVYPSSLRNGNSDYGFNHRRRFSRQRLLKVNEVKSSDVEKVCSMGRSKSGKSKKRVSFRLPEEADIFVYSTVEDEDLLEQSQRSEITQLI